MIFDAKASGISRETTKFLPWNGDLSKLSHFRGISICAQGCNKDSTEQAILLTYG